MIVIKNNPELSTAFKSNEAKDFLLELLKQLHKGRNMKEFLIKGSRHTYNELIEELSKSFKAISRDPKAAMAYGEVERCIDGVRFKKNEVVLDKLSNKKYPITRMYEDDRGLHVQLTVNDGEITWRKLSEIEKVEK